MSHAETKQVINTLLSHIGQNGFDGVSLKATALAHGLGHIRTRHTITTPRSDDQLAHELRRQQLVEVTQNHDTLRIRLSVKGIHRLQRARARNASISTPKTWDGLLRMVAFDIPTRHNESRYLLTSHLKRLDFVLIKKSIWVHPYPCFHAVQAMVEHANIQQFVTFAEINSIDTSSMRQIKKHYPDL